MRVSSYMRAGGELAPVDVELSLAPGLPQFFFLGLADAAIRESELRVKSALRHQGFEPPRAHQVLVHLRPSYLRKTSRGLDLAVAAALLWETGQMRKPAWPGAEPSIYGELTLTGEILRPDDLDDVELSPQSATAVLTGPGGPHPSLETWVAPDLCGLLSPLRTAPRDAGPAPARPVPSRDSWPEPAARLLGAIAAGEHSCVIAGPPGTGKTTVAEAVAAFLSAPTMAEHRQARRLARAFGSEEPAWRPLVQPHHSITPLAMVGGGSPPRPGEITRANGGVLVLDELLEFNPSIQESLREPLESGVIRLARASEARTYPARFALVATTNLCPCGQYDPFAKQSRCHCSRSKRERHLARLSRPFLDRAHILAFTGDWREGRGVLSSAIKESVDRAKEMRERRGQLLPNARVAYESLAQGLDAFAREQIVARPFGSARRSMAILRVARTLADLDGSKQIETGHWSQAMRWCACSFERLAGSV